MFLTAVTRCHFFRFVYDEANSSIIVKPGNITIYPVAQERVLPAGFRSRSNTQPTTPHRTESIKGSNSAAATHLSDAQSHSTEVLLTPPPLVLPTTTPSDSVEVLSSVSPTSCVFLCQFSRQHTCLRFEPGFTCSEFSLVVSYFFSSSLILKFYVALLS
jgi:hypothetical protein